MVTATVTPSPTASMADKQKLSKGEKCLSQSIAPLIGRQSTSWRIPTPLVPKLKEITELSISTPAGLELVINEALRKLSLNPERYHRCLPIRGEHKAGTTNFGGRIPAQLTAKISAHRQKIEGKDETVGQLVKRLCCIAIDTEEDPCIITFAERQAERNALIETHQRKISRFQLLATDNKPSNARLWQQRLIAQQKQLEALLKTPL